ncbi:MAG: hypothetical protein GWP10_06465 [Nitrospiraceae bacterium]|nr:hypothetical protein [Nitrospiraceae bacterium]
MNYSSQNMGGGEYIGVVGEEVIAATLTPREVEQAKAKSKKEEDVSFLKVPNEEELTCVL